MAVATLCAIGVALRLMDIGRESLWLDEAGRVAIAALPVDQILPAVAVVELSPPLYHLLLHGWMNIVGTTETAIRSLSAVLAAPTILVVWLLGREVAGERVGVVSGLLAAVSPFAVHYGQEAAMYGVLLLLGSLTTLAAIKAMYGKSTPQFSWLAVYVGAGILAAYTHYYAALLLATAGVLGLVHLGIRRDHRALVVWVAAHGIIAGACVPWIPVMREQAVLALTVDWTGIEVGDALTLWAAAVLADGAPDVKGWLGLAIFAVASAAGAWRLARAGPRGIFCVGIALLPLILAVIASAPLHSFRERGLIVAAGAVWVVFAAGIFGSRVEGEGVEVSSLARLDWGARLGLGAALAGATVLGLGAHFGHQKEDWRAAARLVASGATRADPIFLIHYGGQLAFDRYFSGPQARVGLPDSFDWHDGLRARFQVSPDDVARRVPQTLAASRQAWVVLSHDQGRGSDYLLAYLDRWGSRASDDDFDGVRVVRYLMR